MTRSRTLPTSPTIAAFAGGAVALSIATAFLLRPRTLADARPFDVAELGARVLIIAPHPDDEVLTAGGTIRQLTSKGAQVRVVIVTAGDGYYRAAKRLGPGPTGEDAYRRLGDLRHDESLAAAAKLGLPASDVISLGFADSGSLALWDADWGSVGGRVGRNGSSQVPYGWAYRPGAAYTGQELASQLVSIVRDFRPDTVIGPDAHETHPDHAAVAAFTLYALDEAGFSGKRLTAIVHFRHYPYPWAHIPSASLAPPPTLAGDGSTWLALPLDTLDEQVKRAAIEEYHSQTAVADLGVYMRAFVRRNELFDLRAPSVPATQTTDTRPSPGATGTVVVTPRPTIVPPVAPPARIGSVRMVRGPGTVWIGMVSDTPISTAMDYRASLRLFGGEKPPARLDVLVHNGTPKALHISADSLVLSAFMSETAGRTLWIGIPASVFDGRTRALLGTISGPPKRPPFRTAWVDITL
jgi:LmbE family N-acetylglucosaminyl deacetylase